MERGRAFIFDGHQFGCCRAKCLQCTQRAWKSAPEFSSNPVVCILDPDDIVLAEMGAGLHLDEFEVDLARIGNSVDAGARQVDRLVLVDEMGFVVAHDFRRAVDDDSVLGAVKMLLQRELRAVLQDDAFDLTVRAVTTLW
jgi:hypothetical protein